MVGRRYLIKLCVKLSGALILVVLMLLMTGCEEYGYTKITQAEDIPENVSQALSETELERGVYFFSSGFTGDDAFIVVCGGDEYSEGYDVELTNFEYNALTFTWDDHPVFGFFVIGIKEDATSKQPEYSKDSKYPFVIFEVKGHGGEQEWLIVPEKEEMAINHWWGLGAKQLVIKSMVNKPSVCKVIESEDELPEYVLRQKDYLTRRIDRGCAMISPGNGNDKCIIISGNEDERPFDVTLEAIKWLPRNNMGSKLAIHQCDIVVRKRFGNESPFYQGNIPYSIVRVHSDEYDKIHVNNVIVINDTLDWLIR